MKSIGFITALADEARSLNLSDNENSANRGHLVEVAGVGIKNASQATIRLLDRGVEGLVSWGTAGALDPSLRPGSLVIYDTVRTISGSDYPCDPAWRVELIRALGALNPIDGSGFTSEHALATTAEKAKIGEQFDCVALDMESAAVGSHASAAGVPYVAIRVIVDPVDFDLPQAALNGLASRGEPSMWPVIRGLIRRPHELPALLKLARCYQTALANLAMTANSLRPNFGMD